MDKLLPNWLTERDRDGMIEIDIGPFALKLTIDQVRESGLSFDRYQDRAMRLVGRAPAWLYALLVFHLVKARCRSIVIHSPALADHPDTAGDIPVFPTRAVPAKKAAWINVESPVDGKQRLEIISRTGPDPDWPIEEVLGSSIPASSLCGSVVLTGKGAVWMYGYLAALLAEQNIRSIFVDFPSEPALFSIGAVAMFEWFPRAANPAPGVNLGVLGDPNTGKSVLSRMLYHMFRRRYRRVWIYDSDQASGTPAWYLHMRSRDRHDEANAYRNRTKRAWTPELEREAAGDIRTMRETLALVTVDLPGGRHPKAGETFAPQRVPPGREVILREIDAFVILAREDNQKSFEAWRADLANHGLDGRIIANWISQNPAASCFSLATFSTPDRLVFEGLERSNLSPEKIAAVSDAVMDAVMEYAPLKKLLASVETVGGTAQ